jgi:glucose-1-phosphate thymidylyltransferase
MKIIIPVAGVGKRLRPHTHTNPKPLLNVAGKPMIYFIVDQIIKEKIAIEFVIITGYMGERISEYLDKTFAGKAKFHYVEQKDPKGLGHAIHHAKPFFKKNEEAFIILGDTLFDVNLKKFVNVDHSVIGVKKVDDPKRFGVVEKDENGFVKRFVEKPKSKKVSPSNEAIVGLYYIKNSGALFNALGSIMKKKVKTGGEYQLTDALENMLNKKEKFVTANIQGWLDCGKPETLLETNRYLLEKLYGRKKYKLNGVKITEPVHIGKKVTFKNAVIGPNATINDGCSIINSTVKDSIIEANTIIENCNLNESIIGKDSIIKNDNLKLNVGDNSEIYYNN